MHNPSSSSRDESNSFSARALKQARSLFRSPLRAAATVLVAVVFLFGCEEPVGTVHAKGFEAVSGGLGGLRPILVIKTEEGELVNVNVLTGVFNSFRVGDKYPVIVTEGGELETAH